jgi:hypothetical protein
MQGSIVLAVPENSEYNSISKMKGQRIGTISDPALEAVIAAHDQINKRTDGATTYLTPPRCISALEDGWCVAIVMDELMLMAYASTYVPQMNTGDFQ